MHPFWLLPLTIGIGGFLLSADQVMQGQAWTGMKILFFSFFASAVLVVIGWFLGNKEDKS